jgi:hypothetical protein
VPIMTVDVTGTAPHVRLIRHRESTPSHAH